MADDTSTPTTPTPDQPQEPAAAAPVVETLGEPGKAALEAERKARRDADRQLKETLARLKEFEDRDKTETQKAADALAATAKERDDARAEAARFRAAATHGLTADDLALLDGIPADQIEERAAKLAARLTPAKLPTAPSAAGQGNVGKPVGNGSPQLARGDLAGMTPEAITQAKAEGRLNTLLGIN